MRQFVIFKPGVDNVGTALRDLPVGTVLEVEGRILLLRDPIPFGHKFAVRDIGPGEAVYKYGQVIGTASRLIHAGEHAHMHNIVSNRGRGDLAGSRG